MEICMENIPFIRIFQDFVQKEKDKKGERGERILFMKTQNITPPPPWKWGR